MTTAPTVNLTVFVAVTPYADFPWAVAYTAQRARELAEQNLEAAYEGEARSELALARSVLAVVELQASGTAAGVAAFTSQAAGCAAHGYANEAVDADLARDLGGTGPSMTENVDKPRGGRRLRETVLRRLYAMATGFSVRQLARSLDVADRFVQAALADLGTRGLVVFSIRDERHRWVCTARGQQVAEALRRGAVLPPPVPTTCGLDWRLSDAVVSRVARVAPPLPARSVNMATLPSVMRTIRADHAQVLQGLDELGGSATIRELLTEAPPCLAGLEDSERIRRRLSQLRALDLVQAARDAADGRTYRYHLTDMGRAALQAAA